MLVLVPTVRTSCTSKDLAGSFIRVWLKVFGVFPSKQSIAVLYAQNFLETGGTQYMWSWNIGNVKAIDIPGQTIKYQMLANVWEIINNKKFIFQPPHPATWFRAFDSLDEGVEHHIGFLRNNRYHIAWTAVEQGDPALFSKLLRQQGYYTAAEKDYTALMNVHFNKFMQMNIYEQVIASLQTIQEEKPVDVIIHPTVDVVVEKPLPLPSEPAKNIFTSIFNKVKSIFK